MRKNVAFLAILSILLLQVNLFAQNIAHLGNRDISPTKTSNKRFITDENGNILMYVNVWGHVAKPGNVLVYDGIDLPTLLALVGGPKPGANFKNIQLIRELPDEEGNQKYVVNMGDFIESGDDSQLVKILPNDTIIVSETLTSYVFNSSRLVSTILQAVSLYITVLIYKDRTS